MLWQQLVPSGTEGARLKAELSLLPLAQFDAAARRLVSSREYAATQRRIRGKTKLSLYAGIERLERRGLQCFPRVLSPKAYLRGPLTPLVRFKFKLRAGVAELRQELERRARGVRGKRLSAACCPYCPGVVETVAHFIVDCPWNSQPRDQFWETLQGVNPDAAATLRGLPADGQAARLLSDVVDPSVDTDTAATLRHVVDGFIEKLRIRLNRRLHPVIVDDAVIAALFAESSE